MGLSLVDFLPAMDVIARAKIDTKVEPGSLPYIYLGVGVILVFFGIYYLIKSERSDRRGDQERVAGGG